MPVEYQKSNDAFCNKKFIKLCLLEKQESSTSLTTYKHEKKIHIQFKNGSYNMRGILKES